MNFKKVVALSICAAMVAGMSMSTVMAADLPDQFKDLKANEAYEFPMMVKSFQSTYWDAAQEGMKKAAEELGVTYTAQGPNSESDIADHDQHSNRFQPERNRYCSMRYIFCSGCTADMC